MPVTLGRIVTVLLAVSPELVRAVAVISVFFATLLAVSNPSIEMDAAFSPPASRLQLAKTGSSPGIATADSWKDWPLVIVMGPSGRISRLEVTSISLLLRMPV